MSLKIRRAVQSLQKMSPAERIQILVRARLMSQQEADKVKAKLDSEAHKV